jgi:membrane associated rhomboid family serine protease
MIAAPGSALLTPAIALDEVRQRIQGACLARSRISISILAIATVILALLGRVPGKSNAAHLATGLLGIIAFMGLDYFLVMRDRAALTERSIFYLYLSRNCRTDLWIGAGVMLFAGATQLTLQSIFGGFEPLILKCGVLYAKLSDGEWWRLLVGPFFHANVMHWVSNLGILLPIGAIAGIISRRKAGAVFLLASVAGALAAWQLAKYGEDAFTGISAGVFGIYGMCSGVALRNARYFPRKLGFTIISFAVMNMYLAEVLNPNSSGIGHVAGCAVGLIYGAFVRISADQERRSTG